MQEINKRRLKNLLQYCLRNCNSVTVKRRSEETFQIALVGDTFPVTLDYEVESNKVKVSTQNFSRTFEYSLKELRRTVEPLLYTTVKYREEQLTPYIVAGVSCFIRLAIGLTVKVVKIEVYETMNCTITKETIEGHEVLASLQLKSERSPYSTRLSNSISKYYTYVLQVKDKPISKRKTVSNSYLIRDLIDSSIIEDLRVLY